MAQSSQSTPAVTANLAGEYHQVNLRDYLNARVAPFLKKAITESLDASYVLRRVHTRDLTNSSETRVSSSMARREPHPPVHSV